MLFRPRTARERGLVRISTILRHERHQETPFILAFSAGSPGALLHGAACNHHQFPTEDKFVSPASTSGRGSLAGR
jgi:hypothetical protein